MILITENHDLILHISMNEGNCIFVCSEGIKASIGGNAWIVYRRKENNLPRVKDVMEIIAQKIIDSARVCGIDAELWAIS